MRVSSLPARIVYTAAALPLGAGAGFYSAMRWLPEFTASHPQIDPNIDGSGIFKIAVCVGAGFAFAVSLFALTLPWIRHRKLSGRPWRIGFSCGLVVLASLLFAEEGFKLVYDLLFAAWLTYILAFTFVRYGVIDEARRRSSSASRY